MTIYHVERALGMSKIFAHKLNFLKQAEFFQWYYHDMNTVDKKFGPPMWQAGADKVSSLSAWPAMAVGQILLTLTKY